MPRLIAPLPGRDAWTLRPRRPVTPKAIRRCRIHCAALAGGDVNPPERTAVDTENPFRATLFAAADDPRVAPARVGTSRPAATLCASRRTQRALCAANRSRHRAEMCAPCAARGGPSGAARVLRGNTSPGGSPSRTTNYHSEICARSYICDKSDLRCGFVRCFYVSDHSCRTRRGRRRHKY